MLALIANSTVLIADEPADKRLVLEEVYVSAQRREESIQDAPISLVAFGEEQLEREGISSLEDIQASAPNVQIAPFPTNVSTLNIFIRGVGLPDSQVTQDSPVAVYLDGVYLAGNVGLALDIADLQRIEILRGPQGALYGRNATGGAIIMVSKEPSMESFEFDEKLSLSNFKRSSLTRLNVPLAENMAMKLAYMRQSEDGFMDNPTGKGDWGDKDVNGARLDMRWEPTDAVSLQYSYERSDIDFYNPTYQAIKPGTPGGASSDLVQDYANNAIRNGPGYSSKRLDELSSSAPLEESNSLSSGHTAVLTYANSHSELKYIFGYRELDNRSYSDLGSGGLDYRLDSNEFTAPDGQYFPLVYFEIDREQLSHEVQFNLDLLEDRLNIVTGAYIFYEKAKDRASPEFHVFHGKAGTSGLVLDGAIIAAYSNRGADTDNEGRASYIRFDYTPAIFASRLHTSLGLRMSDDSRKASAFRGNRSVAYPEVSVGLPTAIELSSVYWAASAEKKFNDFSYEWILAYDLADDVNTYLKYSEAYVNGGFSVRDPDRDGTNNSYGVGFVDGFEPEKVGSYEVGVKSELFEKRVRLNIAGFMAEYDDKQTPFLLPGGSFGDTKTINAGEASMNGLEAELDIIVSENIYLRSSYSYLNAEVDEVLNPATGEDITDQYQFPSAPKHSVNVSLEWDVLKANWGVTSLYLSYSYMDERKGIGFVESYPKDSHYPALDLLNARLSMRDLSVFKGRINLALWCKNALDEEYPVHTVSILPHADRGVMWGQPRSFGVDLNFTL